MSHVIHRSLRNAPIVASRAQGAYIFDTQRKPYLDACSGAAVSYLGCAHPDVLVAMHRQIDQLAYAHTSFFTSDAMERLAEHLTRTASGELNYAYFVSDGSEAIGTALKMARQYFVEIGQPSRTRFIACKQSYHGSTLDALAVGGNEWRHHQFAPLSIDVIHVSACNEYRDRRADETQQQYTERLPNELEQAILEADPETIIGFCAETMVGTTTGATPLTSGHLKGVHRLCNKYDILYIADEMMCGMGCTGTLYTFEQDDVVPDLVTIAKGLGGDYQPIGAALASGTIVSALKAGSKLFQHGHTYICHATAASIALVVQQVIARDNLLTTVKQQGAYLQQALREVLGESPHVGDTRGRGLFAGVELVRDKDSETPSDPTLKLHAAVKANCMACGLMVYPMGGTIDGQYGDHTLIAPPFITTPARIDFVADTLNSVIRKETGKL